MTRYFFDTSALVKIYHQEIGSDIVLPIYNGKDEIFVCELSKIEFASAVLRKFRNNEIELNTGLVLIDKFLSDLSIRFRIITLLPSLIDTAFDLITDHGKIRHLVTLDAIQLATFLIIADDNTLFVCADERLNQIVQKLSFRVLNMKNEV